MNWSLGHGIDSQGEPQRVVVFGKAIGSKAPAIKTALRKAWGYESELRPGDEPFVDAYRSPGTTNQKGINRKLTLCQTNYHIVQLTKRKLLHLILATMSFLK